MSPTPFNRETGHRFDTLRALVGRELKARYKGSFLGVLWAVLTPLGTALVLEFVFGRVLQVQVPHFAAFIYSGLLPWVWFSASVEGASGTLATNRDLVRTPFFPKPLLPAVVTCTNFLLYLFALPVLLLLMTADGVPLSSTLMFLPAIWAVQALITLAVAVLIAAIGVVIRDVQHVMGVVLLFWFYLTPVFYGLDQVPAAYSGWFALNPLAPIVTAHRAVTLEGRPPDWSPLGLCALGAAMLLLASLAVFRALEDAFVDQA